MVRVAIVLVDYNGLDDTRKCLESLKHLTAPAEIIVVDNASAQIVSDALKVAHPGVHFLRSPANGGWAGGNNLGMQHALHIDADLVLLLNNDTAVEPQFVERLVKAADAYPNHGILGPVIRFMAEPHEVQTEGVRFNTPHEPGFFQRVAIPLRTTDPPTVVDVDIVNGCCLMVRRRVIETIGFIDEKFFLIHEESDFCLRAQDAGFRLGVIAEALVFHKGSSTFEREGRGLQRYYDARNLLRLLRKHRGQRGRRTPWHGFTHALRYALSRYALEREKGYRESADSVLEGLYDGMTRRYGERSSGWRPGFSLMKRAVSILWRIKR